jgi:hypothetical protein
MTQTQQQALDLANEIYRLTHAIKLTGQPTLEEEEIKVYADLMDAREPLVTQLTSLLEGMDPVDAAIKKTMTDIINMDKGHQEIVTHIKNHLQFSIKEINDGRHLSDKYVAHAESGSIGLLDTKQ